MAPRKTTRKTTKSGRSVSKKTTSRSKRTTTKKAAKPRISSNQAKGFGSFLKEVYSDE